jgi:cytochrome P450
VPAPGNEPHFDPYSRAFAADPYAVYAQLRETTPVFVSDELGMRVLTRYTDIFRALTDRRLARAMSEDSEGAASQQGQGGSAASPHGAGVAMPFYDRYVRVNLLETEGETHARLRRLLAGTLNPRRIAALAARIEAITADLLGRIERDAEFDFIRELAEPLPVTMISELLGWPEEERHRLRPWSAAIVRLYEKDATDDDARRAEDASREFASRIESLAEERKASPKDDFISALAALEDEAEALSRDELIASCMLLLNAGHEATVNAAGNGLLALLHHPQAMSRLRGDPSLIETAVEEMLRYDPPLHLFHRYALEDLTIAGQALPKGATVGLLYGSANRDPDAFPEPDAFDIARTPNRHLAFGAATHFCLGAPLARLELRTLFRTLLEQTSGIELIGDEPEYRRGLVFRGLKKLTVRCS